MKTSKLIFETIELDPNPSNVLEGEYLDVIEDAVLDCSILDLVITASINNQNMGVLVIRECVLVSW